MEDRPCAELVAVSDAEVDLVALRARVRTAAAARRGGAAPPPPTSSEGSGAAGPPYHALHDTAEVVPYTRLTSGGPLLAALKRGIRRGLRWYLWPVAAQLSSHNGAVADVVAEHSRQLTWIRLEADRLRHDMALQAMNEERSAR